MPTTYEETTKIIQISSEYLPIDKLAELFDRLNREVGQVSENYSVRDSLSAMHKLTYGALQEMKAQFNQTATVYGSIPIVNQAQTLISTRLLMPLRVALISVVIVHVAIIAANAAAMVFAPIYTPWYVGLPLVTYLLTLITTRTRCPLTDLENWIRRSLGLKEIRNFIGHYIMKPIYVAFGKKHKLNEADPEPEVIV